MSTEIISSRCGVSFSFEVKGLGVECATFVSDVKTLFSV